jgi:CelD/BcsL family acetyltransferase involved in cellulose biosynthesis
MLMILAQTLTDELVDGPTASIPPLALEEAQWSQAPGTALVHGRGEHAESSSLAMSTMMAILKMAKDRQDTYVSIMNTTSEALEDKLKYKRRAKKYRKCCAKLDQV